jgi:exosortase
MIRSAIAAGQAIPRWRILRLLGLISICAWAYWPTLGAMAGKWLHDPQYAHGYLVPFFSLFLLWRRRALLSAAAPQYNWWGVLLVLAGAGLHVLGAYIYFDWVDAFSLLPCLAGFCVLLGGWPALRWAWPAIAFLLFMIPLPFRVETAFGLRLQSVATLASTYTLQALGLPALSEGNTILLPGGAIGVAEACSGLSMLTTFFALATAVALVISRPWLDKVVVLLSAAPIAIAANVARITATGLAQEWVGRDLAHHVFHDLAGWLMMPVALALLWAELRLLSFLLVEPPADAPMAVLPSPVLPAAGENGLNRASRRRKKISKKISPGDPRPARPL